MWIYREKIISILPLPQIKEFLRAAAIMKFKGGGDHHYKFWSVVATIKRQNKCFDHYVYITDASKEP